jgi:Leucine-rich repeat (LRR) protein
MKSTPIPPGYQREQALIDCLGDLRSSLRDLEQELPYVNDERTRSPAMAVLDAGTALLDMHESNPGPTIPDDLAALLSGVRALRLPARDPDLGTIPTLQRLREAKGLIVASLMDALEAGEAIGLRPRRSPIPADIATDVSRSGIDGLLRGIADRLEKVEASLDALDEVQQIPTDFVQQNDLLSFYIGSMQVEIDLAKLQLSIGEHVVNFDALSRAVETMANLTKDFVATVRAWRGKVSQAVVSVVGEVRVRVRKVTTGVKAAVKWVVRTSRAKRPQHSAAVIAEDRHGSTDGAYEVEMTDAEAAERDVVGIILRGETPPLTLAAKITKLTLGKSGIDDLRPLAVLKNLRSLDLRQNPVSDLLPLVGLRGLERLNLRSTRVNVVDPLAKLVNLKGLNLRGTFVSDLRPLAGLSNLQGLYAGKTLVSDLSPLQGMTDLRELNLDLTRISDLSPLAGLTRIWSLALGDNPDLSDLRPLSGLVALRRLILEHTGISDVSPLAALVNLEWLDLSRTQVADLSPLSRLAKLRALLLGSSAVLDLTPLSELHNLRQLNLTKTHVSNLSPLANLANLERVTLTETLATDLKPVVHVRTVVEPDGRKNRKHRGPSTHVQRTE